MGEEMVKEAAAQNVMHVKLGCHQKWVECILNSNHLFFPARRQHSDSALRSPAVADRHSLTLDKDAEDWGGPPFKYASEPPVYERYLASERIPAVLWNSQGAHYHSRRHSGRDCLDVT